MNNILIEKFDTWQSSLFTTEFPLHDETQASLKELILQQGKQQTHTINSLVATTAKHALQESTFDFLEQPNSNIQALKDFISSAVSYAAYEANAEYWPEDIAVSAKVVESWYHITTNGGYHDAHTHPNCSWCGIYFLDAGESDLETQNGVNRFYDPRPNAGHFQDPGTAYLNQQGFWDIAPKNGQCVIFPSYLTHAALPYFGQSERIVIAFNCIIEEA